MTRSRQVCGNMQEELRRRETKPVPAGPFLPSPSLKSLIFIDEDAIQTGAALIRNLLDNARRLEP